MSENTWFWTFLLKNCPGTGSPKTASIIKHHDVFKPKGLVGSLSVEKRLSYFKHFLKSSAKLQWNMVFVKCQKQVLKDLLMTDNKLQIRQERGNHFYEYLRSTVCLMLPTRSLKEQVSSKLRMASQCHQDLNACCLSERSGSTCIKPCGRRVVTYSPSKRDTLASISPSPSNGAWWNTAREFVSFTTLSSIFPLTH